MSYKGVYCACIANTKIMRVIIYVCSEIEAVLEGLKDMPTAGIDRQVAK